MLRIYVNVNRQDVTLSFSVGQQFPKVEGRLISVEASGKELATFLAKSETPVNVTEGMVLSWHGKFAGRALQTMRELFDRA